MWWSRLLPTHPSPQCCVCGACEGGGAPTSPTTSPAIVHIFICFARRTRGDDIFHVMYNSRQQQKQKPAFFQTLTRGAGQLWVPPSCRPGCAVHKCGAADRGCFCGCFRCQFVARNRSRIDYLDPEDDGLDISNVLSVRPFGSGQPLIIYSRLYRE